jgi:hypothetical protein
LHIAAIRPDAVTSGAGSGGETFTLLAKKQRVNVHDFVADLIEGTWLAFDRDGTSVRARLTWISPWRATYIFSTPSGSSVMVFTPEDLAWEMSSGRVGLVLEPVALFDRAVSATLEYLANHSAARHARETESLRADPKVAGVVAATVKRI